MHHLCGSWCNRALSQRAEKVGAWLLLATLSFQLVAQAGVLRDHVSDSSCWEDTQLIDNCRCADPSISATAWTLVDGDGGELAEVSIVGIPLLCPSGDPGPGSALTNFSRWKIIAVPEGSPALPCYTNTGVIPTNPDYDVVKGRIFDYGIHVVSLAITNSGYTLEVGRRYRVSLTPESDLADYTVFFCAVQSRGEGGSIGTTADLYESGTEGWPLTSLRDLEITYDYFAYRVITTMPVPRLTIETAGPNVVISWPSNLRHQGLHETGDLLQGEWKLVEASLSTNSVVLPASGVKHFYRLRL